MTFAEQVAKRLHEEYEAGRARFGIPQDPITSRPWEELPQGNRDLMVLAVEQVVKEYSLQ